MKDNRLLELMSGLDPELISEAADKHGENKPKLARRISPMIAIAAVTAALIVSAGSAYAVSVYAEERRAVARNEIKAAREAAGTDRGLDSDERFTHYVDDKALAEVYNKTDFAPIVTENAHLRLTVQACLADEHFVTGVMLLEGLDDEGKEYVRSRLTLTDEEFMKQWEKMQQPGYEYEGSLCPWMPVKDSSGEWETIVSYGMDGQFGTEDGSTSFEFTLCKDKLTEHAGSSSVHVELLDSATISGTHGGTDDLRPGIFEGMSFDLPTEKNVGDLTLEAANGDRIYVSELGFYGSYDGSGGFFELSYPVIFSYQDGSKEIFTGSGEYYDDDQTYTLRGQEPDSLHTLIELDGLTMVEISGSEYFPIS